MKTYKTKRGFDINNLVYIKCDLHVSLYLGASTTNLRENIPTRKIKMKDGRVLIIKSYYNWIIRRKYNIRIPRIPYEKI